LFCLLLACYFSRIFMLTKSNVSESLTYKLIYLSEQFGLLDDGKKPGLTIAAASTLSDLIQ